ncbi:MAG: gliding motility-associated C-terminal domain-containing protein [Saprospiraceae bacterium]|nr:gliding motility-associated C-terminal domain-containing protein [Saprospiraceae bacterium]
MDKRINNKMFTLKQKLSTLLKMSICIIFVVGFLTDKIQATHIVGGELTYRRISPEVFQVRLTLRRDCLLGSPDAQFDPVASIGIFSSSGAPLTSLADNGQLRIPFMASDTLNQYIRSDCGFEGTQVCVHETVYQRLVRLPFREGGYILAYQRCCRNETLANIMNPLETGSTYWVSISEDALTLGNSSPVFKEWPDVYICANNNLVFDHSATDIDGDSLVYKLITPNTGATFNMPMPQPPFSPPYALVQWAPPYSLQNLLGGTPLQIDSKTGVLTANPNLVGQFLVGVSVEEYRNGKLISTVRRDFQYNVRVCSPPPTAIFTTSETNCDGLTVEFQNNSISSSNYQWYFNFPSTDPAFTSTVRNPVFTYPQSGIYTVKLRVTRGSDGCFDTLLQQVSVFTNKIEPDFKFSLSECDNENDTLTIQATDLSVFNEPGFVLNNWEWAVVQNGVTSFYTGQSPFIKLAYSGNINIKLTVTASNGCKSVIEKNIVPEDIIPEVDFNYELRGCPTNGMAVLQFNNLSAALNPFATITSSTWTINGENYTGNPVIVQVPKDISLVTATLETGFEGSCIATLTKTLPFEPLLATFNTSDTECTGLEVSFFNTSSNAQTFAWNFNFPSVDPQFLSSETNPIYTFPAPGIYNVLLSARRSSDGCIDSIFRQVAVFNNNINVDYSYELTDCSENKDSLFIKLSDKSVFNEPGYTLTTRQWSIIQNGNNVMLAGNEVSFGILSSGTVNIKLTVNADNGCTAEQIFDIDPATLIPNADFTIDFEGCPDGDNVTLKITDLSDPLNPFGTIQNQEFTIGTNIYSGPLVFAEINKNSGIVEVAGVFTFGDNCFVTETREIDINLVFPLVDYNYVPDNCPDDLNVTLGFEYSPALANNINAINYEWGIISGGVSNTFTNSDFLVTIPKDSFVDVFLTVNYANGCIDTLTDRFLPGPFATIQLSTQPVILCPGQTKALVQNPNPDWTYTWSPTEGLDLTDPSNPLVNINQNMTYFVTVTDGLCTVTSSVSVVALGGEVVIGITGESNTCDGEVNLSVEGGVGEGQYLWSTEPDFATIITSGPSLTTSFSGNSETYYALFEGELCSTMPAIFVVTNQTPSILAASPYNICPGDTVTLPIYNEIQSHILTFSWKDDPRIISGQDSGNIKIGVGNDQTEDFYLVYTVTNQFGCVLTDSIHLILSQNPVVDFEFNLPECGEYKVCFTIDGGDYNGFVRWNFGDPLSSNDTSPEKAPCYVYTEPGVFDVVLENLVGVCPFKKVEKTIIVNPQIKLDQLGPFTVCPGDTVSLVGTSNLIDATYHWTDLSGNVISMGNVLDFQVTNDVRLILNGKDIYGCKDSIEIEVNLFDFDFQITQDDSLCVNENSRITLNIANPEEYLFNWSPSESIISGGTTNNPLINATEGLELTVEITNIEYGCKDTGTVSPMITKPFDFTIETPDIFCFDQNGQINLTILNPENYAFNWTPADCFISGTQTPNPVVRLIAGKTLSVTITNLNSGCKESISFDPEVGSPIDVNVTAEPDLTIYEGEDIEIKVVNPIINATYNWSTGESGLSILVSPIQTTSYLVTVTDQDGCTATDQVTVEVRTAQCDETDVYLPNAFTPNGDGNNDVLLVRSNFIDELELIIYNRWGQEVFRTTDKNVGWDGTFQGRALSPDSFAFYLRVLCINAEEYKKQGNINLLR